MYLHERMLNLSAPGAETQAKGYNTVSLPEVYENVGFFIYLLSEYFILKADYFHKNQSKFWL